MECSTVQEQLSAFIDGELEPGGEPRLFAHLADCESCQGFFRDAQAMHAEIGREPALRAPVKLDRRVLGSRAATTHGRSTMAAWILHAARTPLSVPMPVAALAVVLLLAAVVSLFRAPGRSTAVPATPVREVVYVMTLPAVEVEVRLPSTGSTFR